jgi:type IV secretory pathway TraG/TraD family ATPase VirD4
MNPFPQSDVVLGLHEGAPFLLDSDTRRRHLHVVGQTGTGKSTLFANLIAQDLVGDQGVALLDPHGTLAQGALGSVPSRRAHEVVYLDPADMQRPIGFNVLDGVPADQHAVAADGVVSAFHHVWPESWGPRLEYLLTHAIRALLCNPGSTLLGVPKLFTDGRYRARILVNVRDPVLLAFWRNEWDSYDARFRNEATAPILNKLGKVLADNRLRNIAAQPKSTIDLRRIMDEGRILIVNLSKGALGEGTSHLLGALLTTALATAALSRTDTQEHKRRPFYLYADEFQNYASNGFAVILSEARKYALALTLGHQYLGQLPENLRQAVLGNAASFVAFRVGAEDAPLIAKHLGLKAELETSGMGQREIAAVDQLTSLPPLPSVCADDR